ncbi:MAG: MFS transporter [Rhodospirillales bacterium]
MSNAVVEWVKRAVDVREEELRALLWAFVYFFCLLCAYYVLRPVLDAMRLAGGVLNLQWQVTATFVTMLIAVPIFGTIVAKLPRRIFLPAVYWFFIVNLVLFYFALQAKQYELYTARIFFVWVSVFNLFVMSVFWSFMADLFSSEQGKRLFGFIAAGGTAGALVGPALTAGLAKTLGTPNLLLISAALLGVALLCIQKLLLVMKHKDEQTYESAGAAQTEKLIGGGILTGAAQVFRSPYLIGICLYLFIYTALSTFLYFQQAHIVAGAFESRAERTQVFAVIDLCVSIVTLLTQLFVTGRLMRRFGMSLALAFVPIVSVIGFIVLGLYPTLIVLIAFQALRRASNYAISRPAREVLYTVVSAEQKYKSKNFIDTVVYRGGDVLSGWAFAGVKALGTSLSSMAFIAVPIAVLGCLVAVLLGRKQAELSGEPAVQAKPAETTT